MGNVSMFYLRLRVIASEKVRNLESAKVDDRLSRFRIFFLILISI